MPGFVRAKMTFSKYFYLEIYAKPKPSSYILLVYDRRVLRSKHIFKKHQSVQYENCLNPDWPRIFRHGKTIVF